MAVNADFSNYNNKFYNYENYKKLMSCEENYLNYIYSNIFPVYQKIFYNIFSQLKNLSDYNTGYLMREDIESLNNFNLNVKTFDLSAAGCGRFYDEALSYMLSKLFLSVINIFNIIVTDRLHIAICSAKLGKEVYLIDNIYKKNSSVYNYSLKEFKNVHLLQLDNPELELKKYEITNCGKGFNKENFKMYNSMPITFKDFIYEYGSIEKVNYSCKRFI